MEFDLGRSRSPPAAGSRSTNWRRRARLVEGAQRATNARATFEEPHLSYVGEPPAWRRYRSRLSLLLILFVAIPLVILLALIFALTLLFGSG